MLLNYHYRAIAIEHDNRTLRLRECNTETQADRTAHRAHHVNLIRPVIAGV